MKRFLILITISLSTISCFHQDKGQLIFVDNDPQKGFQFPYFLFLPDGISPKNRTTLLVEPNNSGFASDDFQEHLEKARRTATKDFYMGNYVAHKLKCPLLVPVFPRPKSDWKIYTHALDRDVMLQKNTPLERIDLQLIAMVQDAKKRLKEMAITVNEKVLMTGFSASGTFVNRFTILHPEIVKATAAGGLNGLLMLPLEKLYGQELDYPLGIHDFNSLCGQPFDSASFKKVPQLLFMGELDDNDAILFDDGYDVNERQVIFETLGEQMQPMRWNKCREIYNHQHINAHIVTYPGLGHEHPDKIKAEVLGFFKDCLAEKAEGN